MAKIVVSLLATAFLIIAVVSQIEATGVWGLARKLSGRGHRGRVVGAYPPVHGVHGGHGGSGGASTSTSTSTSGGAAAAASAAAAGGSSHGGGHAPVYGGSHHRRGGHRYGAHLSPSHSDTSVYEHDYLDAAHVSGVPVRPYAPLRPHIRSGIGHKIGKYSHYKDHGYVSPIHHNVGHSGHSKGKSAAAAAAAAAAGGGAASTSTSAVTSGNHSHGGHGLHGAGHNVYGAGHGIGYGHKGHGYGSHNVYGHGSHDVYGHGSHDAYGHGSHNAYGHGSAHYPHNNRWRSEGHSMAPVSHGVDYAQSDAHAYSSGNVIVPHGEKSSYKRRTRDSEIHEHGDKDDDVYAKSKTFAKVDDKNNHEHYKKKDHRVFATPTVYKSKNFEETWSKDKSKSSSHSGSEAVNRNRHRSSYKKDNRHLVEDVDHKVDSHGKVHDLSTSHNYRDDDEVYYDSAGVHSPLHGDHHDEHGYGHGHDSYKHGGGGAASSSAAAAGGSSASTSTSAATGHH